MKKILILFAAIFCFAVIFTNCGFKDMEMPETVSIKTDAVYEFPILDLSSEAIQKKLDFSSLLDIEKLLSSDENSESKFEVYKYNNGSKFQQFLLHMPLSEVEFDFSKSFGEMNFSNVLKEGFGVDKEFKVPDVQALNDTRDLDLTSINEQLNNGVTFVGEVPTASSETKTLSVNFMTTDGINFESVTYSKGTLIVDVSNQTIGGYSYGGYATGKVTLFDESTHEQAEGTFEGNIAKIDISGMTIKKQGLKLKFEEPGYGGFIIRIESSSKMSKAKGLSLPSNLFNVPDVKVSFPLALSEDMSDVVIEEGSLKVLISTGETWSANVINDYNIDITGGLTCHVDKAHPEKDLIGEALQNKDIEANAKVDVVLQNATVDFDNPPQVSVVASIKKVSAVIAMPEDFKTTISQDMDVPDTLTDYVQSITWKEIGFNVLAETNLPQDNDIKINIQSSTFGITDTASQTIVSGLKEDDENYKQKLSFITKADATHPLETVFKGEGAIDKINVSGTVELPGASTGKLSVKKVEPGATYKVSIQIEPVFDWDTAKVKLPEGTDAEFKGDFNTSINKKTMFESLGSEVAAALDNIQISNMPLYLFANVPNVFGDKSAFGGTIKAYYGKEDDNGTITPVENAEEKYFLGSAEGPEGLDFKPFPALVKNEAGEVTTDFSKYKSMSFADALNITTNDKDSTLCLSYDVGLTGAKDGVIELNNEILQQMQNAGSTKISIDVALILNLDFTLVKPIKIDLMDLINSSDEEGSEGSGTTTKTDQERDLLGRAEKTDASSYEKYLESVKYASLIIKDTELPIAGTIKLAVNMYNDPEYNEEREAIKFGNKETTTITINPSKFLATYPLEPSIKLIIGDKAGSSFGLLRETKISGKIRAKIVADKDKPIQVYPFSEQNNGGAE